MKSLSRSVLKGLSVQGFLNCYLHSNYIESHVSLPKCRLHIKAYKNLVIIKWIGA